MHAHADAHIGFALHPDHRPAVIATTSGPTGDAARSHLHDWGFRSTGPATMVLARIDREEPYYTARAKDQLRKLGFTTSIDRALQEEIDTEWDWGSYPTPWCTREEVREVSAEAQRFHDAIAEGHLTVHLHADDGHTTVAVGSYTTGVYRHVHLHGENHLWVATGTFETEDAAVAEFQRLYSVAVRPGPAPLTELEQAVRQALTATTPAAANAGAPTTAPPVAEPGEHEAFLKDLFEQEPQWERYRPFDETTIASHESLTVRVEFDHEVRHRTDVAWTIAEYDGPVGERLWHATITANTPVPLIHAMLQYLDAPPLTAADHPDNVLHDAAWHPASHPARTTWAAPDRTIAFESTPHAVADRWTLYGGEDLDRAAWTIRLSAGAPDSLLAQLAGTAAALFSSPTRSSPRPLPVSVCGLSAATPAPRARVRYPPPGPTASATAPAAALRSSTGTAAPLRTRPSSPEPHASGSDAARPARSQPEMRRRPARLTPITLKPFPSSQKKTATHLMRFSYLLFPSLLKRSFEGRRSASRRTSTAAAVVVTIGPGTR